MTLISDVAAALIAGGFATALGTDLFPRRFPPSPLKCIMIKELDGKVPSEEMGGDGVDYPGFQIQVRDIDEAQAQADAEAIRLALNDTTQGSYSIFTTRSQPSDVTSPEDLAATDGPVYRFSVDFETTSAR